MPSPHILTELRKIGEYLPCSHADIEWGLSAQAQERASGNIKRLGEILIERATISRENLVEALDQQRLDRLRGCALLADLTGEELESIAAHSEEITLASGEKLFGEGRRGDGVYIVLSGRILLYRRGDIQKGIPLGAALRGDVLGEDGYFVSGTRPFSACATEPSVLLKVRYELLPKRLRCWDKNLSIEFPAEGSPDELMAQILEKAALLLRADRAFVLFRDPEQGDYHTKVTDADGEHELVVPAGTGITGWAALKRQIVNIREAASDVRFDTGLDVRTGYRTRTLLAAPVFNAQAEVIAVLMIVNKVDGLFDEDDEALLHAFSRQSAAAIEYCRTLA